MAFVPLVWPRSGGVQQPALLSGDTDGYPYASNTAGNVIVGVSGGYPGSLASGAPVRWDSLAATELTGIASMNYSMGLARAALLLLGANGTSINLYSQWTGGGGAGGNLSIPSGFTGTAPPTYSAGGSGFVTSYLRPCSDDGLTVIGRASGGSGGNPANIAVAWNSGTPTKLLSSNAPTTDFTFSGSCSPGGVIFVGSEDAGALRNATYWTITLGTATSHPLILAASSGVLGAEGRWSNGSDNVLTTARVYGIASDATTTGPAYWDSLNTSGPDPVLPGSPTAWGVIHIMTAPGGGSRSDCVLSYVSETNGVAVGISGDGATRWDNTVPTALDPPVTFVSAVATCCSADGVYVGGQALDADGKTWPVYWDNANAVHLLPTIADPTDGTQGLVVGVSRDGTTFFGGGNTPTTPPTTPSISMDNVIVTCLGPGSVESPCTTAQFSSGFGAVAPSVGLRWSDTRGKTFGNAVPQEFRADPLGQPQWNRTGMARDRVFELFWTAPFKTALNGAFVEVMPLKS